MIGRRRDRARIAWAYAIAVALAAIFGLVFWRVIAAVTGAATGPWPGSWPVRWAQPWALALAVAPILVWWRAVHAGRRQVPTLLFSRAAEVAQTRPGWVARMAALPSVLRVLALLLMVVALARPQAHLAQNIELEGIDVMFVLDLSQSMEAEDLEPNRLDASQRVLRQFIAQRHGDRVGLVAFGRAPMLAAPLTLDTRALDEVVADLAIGDVPPRGTAIGDALGLALAVLRRSDTDSKVIILLSDGGSNVTNKMSPGEATMLAKAMGVRVFSVLMGAEDDAGEHRVDPDLLQAIAADTGGEFFRAGDAAALEASFREVRDTLDTTRRELKSGAHGADIFGLFAWPGVLLLFVELALRLTRWRRFP